MKIFRKSKKNENIIDFIDLILFGIEEHIRKVGLKTKLKAISVSSSVFDKNNNLKKIPSIKQFTKKIGNKKITIVVGARRSGKTTKLIKLAHKKNIVIVCLNNTQKKLIIEISKRMNKEIKEPVTYNEILKDTYKFRGKNITNIAIDDAVLFFFFLFK